MTFPDPPRRSTGSRHQPTSMYGAMDDETGRLASESFDSYGSSSIGGNGNDHSSSSGGGRRNSRGEHSNPGDDTDSVDGSSSNSPSSSNSSSNRTRHRRPRWSVAAVLLAAVGVATLLAYMGRTLSSGTSTTHPMAMLYTWPASPGKITSANTALPLPSGKGIISGGGTTSTATSTATEEDEGEPYDARRLITKLMCIQRVENVAIDDVADDPAFLKAFTGTISTALSTSSTNIVVDNVYQADQFLDPSEWPDAVDVQFEVTMAGTTYMSVQSLLIASSTTDRLNAALHRAGYPKATAGAPMVTTDLSPTFMPTPAPTVVGATNQPTTGATPSQQPTVSPAPTLVHGQTYEPTVEPTPEPTNVGDTEQPTVEATPTPEPTTTPAPTHIGYTVQPTAEATPTQQPTQTPAPTNVGDTVQPTSSPTSRPTSRPTSTPTTRPTTRPTSTPTSIPTSRPTAIPTMEPTPRNTGPTNSPNVGGGTATPTADPTEEPTEEPSEEPSSAPIVGDSSQPTARPTARPTAVPTVQPAGSLGPNHSGKTRQPTGASQFSYQPTDWRYGAPTRRPAMNHGKPSYKPTNEPTPLPTVETSSVQVTQTVTGVSILATREDAFTDAFDDAAASAIDAYSAAQGGGDSNCGVVTNGVAGSEGTSGVDVTYTATCSATNPDTITDAVNNEDVQAAISDALQDAGFSSASVGDVVETSDVSPTASPTPMPTADVVTVLAVQSVTGLPLETGQDETFQDTLANAVGYATGVPGRQVEVVGCTDGVAGFPTSSPAVGRRTTSLRTSQSAAPRRRRLSDKAALKAAMKADAAAAKKAVKKASKHASKQAATYGADTDDCSGQLECLVVATDANISPKTLTEEMESSETQAKVTKYLQDAGYVCATATGASVSNLSPTVEPTPYMPTAVPTSAFVVLSGDMTISGVDSDQLDTAGEALLESVLETGIADCVSDTPSYTTDAPTEAPTDVPTGVPAGIPTPVPVKAPTPTRTMSPHTPQPNKRRSLSRSQSQSQSQSRRRLSHKDKSEDKGEDKAAKKAKKAADKAAAAEAAMVDGALVDASQVSVDSVSSANDQTSVGYTVYANDASASQMTAGLTSAACQSSITSALQDAGFTDAQVTDNSVTNLSPTPTPSDAPSTKTKYPSPEPTATPTSLVAKVLVHQGISGVDAEAYNADPLGFEACVKMAVAEVLGEEPDEMNLQGVDLGPSAAPVSGDDDQVGLGPSAAPVAGDDDAAGQGPSAAPAAQGPTQGPAAVGPTQGPAASAPSAAPAAQGPTEGPAAVGAPSAAPAAVGPTQGPAAVGAPSASPASVGTPSASPAAVTAAPVVTTAAPAPSRTQSPHTPQPNRRRVRRLGRSGTDKSSSSSSSTSSSSGKEKKDKDKHSVSDIQVSFTDLTGKKGDSTCTMTTQYQVAMAKRDSTSLGSSLSHENATAVLTKYLKWYGYTTAVACPDATYEDQSPTFSPTTIQPSHRPSARPTSTPTLVHTAVVGALQEVNGLSLADGNDPAFLRFFANYTATKAGVPVEAVNVTGAFPASLFMATGQYKSMHDPSRGYGAPGDQTVLKYTVTSLTLSEATLVARLNRAILANETTAAIHDYGYTGSVDLYKIMVIKLSPTHEPTSQPAMHVPTPAPTLVPLSDMATVGIAVGSTAGVVLALYAGYYSYVHFCLRKSITAV